MAHSFGGLALCLALAEIQPGADRRIALVAPATESPTAFEQFFRFLHIKDPVIKERFNKMVVELSGYPVSWFSIPRTLPQIGSSILWVHDEEDTVTPFSDVKPVIDQNHPGIQFVLTRGLGHRRIYRDAVVSQRIIDFL
jgi:predicted alpha/beta hydrolase family esterase